jgi:hypothetical protein
VSFCPASNIEHEINELKKTRKKLLATAQKVESDSGSYGREAAIKPSIDANGQEAEQGHGADVGGTESDTLEHRG